MNSSKFTCTELNEILASDSPITLVDVRTPAEFASGHLAGAHNIPLDKFDPARLEEVSEPICLICRSGGRARQAGERCIRAGMTEFKVLDGGMAAWTAAGLPIVSQTVGPTVISLERQVRILVGAIVLIGSLLAMTMNKYWSIVPAFFGAGLIFNGVTDFCGLAILLSRMWWNRAPADHESCCVKHV